MPQSSPQIGEVYRHFKGKMYRVQGIATHSETGEALVIYQGLYGGFEVFARPYESFIEKLDHKKYEGVSDQFRFTFVPMATEIGNIENTNSKDDRVVEKEQHISEDKIKQKESREDKNPLLDFLDTDDFDEKYEILCHISDSDLTDVLIDNLAVTLDVVIPEGPIEQRFSELKTCVRTRKKYESIRLR